MNQLAKKYQCPCGKMKKIDWEDAKLFEKGKKPFTVGHSQCPRCEVLQVHFSGDPIYIQQFIDESGLFDYFTMDDLQIDKRSCH